MSDALGVTRLVRLLGEWRAGGEQHAYTALAGGIERLLLDGRVAAGSRLPAERELAAGLGISRNTVTAAYAWLRERELVESRRGAGSRTRLPAGRRMLSSGLWVAEDVEVIDWSCAAFPAPEGLAEAVRAVAGEIGCYADGAGYFPLGLSELRAAVARRYRERGLATTEEQIMITTGAQQALDLVLRLLVSPGDVVLTETPTYPNTMDALVAARTRLVSVGLGPEGWDVDALVAALRHHRARLAFLLPDFQNPTGHLLAEDDRRTVVEAAHASDTWLVVDESFVEFNVDDVAMPPPMAAFDRHGQVITTGSMSKTLWGGLRIGWIRASSSVLRRLAPMRLTADLSGPVLDQLVALRLSEELDETISRRLGALRERRSVLVDALRAALPSWAFRVPPGGASVWVELDAAISTALTHAVAARGGRLTPGPRFGHHGTLERFLRLPFTQTPDQLAEGVRRLASARADVGRGVRVELPQPTVLV